MFRQHYRFLCLVSFGIVKDQDAAEDIVQDFFLQLWQRRMELSSIISFQAYAARAVKNLSISHLRKEKQLPAADEQQLSALSDKTDPLQEKEFLLAGEAMTAKVMQVVEMLPAERKKIFLLHVIERLSYAQIAERNHISQNTVKTQMKKAYAFLRERMAGDTLGLLLLSILLDRI